MSKYEKILAKLVVTPTPVDFKWDDLATLLHHLGYVELKNSGSRRKFYNKEKNLLIICHKPHPRPAVDRGCIADVVEHLKLHGLI